MIVSFLSPLDVEEVRPETDPARWRLTAPLRVEIEGRPIEVPAGFVTDFASVPRVPIAYLVAGGRGNQAATLHDWLYSKQSSEPYDRAQADLALRAGLVGSGIEAPIADAMYAAVRLFGESHWKT